MIALIAVGLAFVLGWALRDLAGYLFAPRVDPRMVEIEKRLLGASARYAEKPNAATEAALFAAHAERDHALAAEDVALKAARSRWSRAFARVLASVIWR